MGSHFDRGGVLFHLGRLQEAVEAFSAELCDWPQSAAAYSARASALLNLSQVDASEEDIRQALAIDPEFAFAHYLLSFIWQRRHDRDRALSAIREAIRLQQIPLYFHRLGELQAAYGDFAGCLASVGEALALDPQHEDSLLLQAKALEATQQVQQASEVLKRALVIAPEDPGFHRALGQVTLNLGQPEVAIEHLREARRISPNSHNDPDALATAHGRRRRLFKAISFLRKEYRTSTPTRRWIIQAVGGSSVLILPLIVAAFPEESPVVLAVIGMLAGNVFVLFHEFRLWTLTLGRAVARRELDLRRRDLVRKSFSPVVVLFRMHLVFTIIGAALGVAPFAGVFLAAFSLPFPLYLELQKKGGAYKWFFLPTSLIAGSTLAGVGCIAIFMAPWLGISCWAGTMVLSFLGRLLLNASDKRTRLG